MSAKCKTDLQETRHAFSHSDGCKFMLRSAFAGVGAQAFVH